MKQKVGKLTHEAGNSYRDERGRLLVMDFKKKIGYVVNKNEERKVGILQARAFICLMICIVLGFYIDWIIAIGISAAIYLFTDWYFKKKYLPTLDTFKTADFPTKPTLVEIFVETGKMQTALRLACSIVLPVLLVVNCFITLKGKEVLSTNDTILLVFSVVTAIVSAVLAFYNIKALSILGKENK